MKALLAFAPLFSRLKGALALALFLSLLTVFAGIGLLGLSGWFLTAAALSTAGAAFNLFAPSAGVRGLSFVRILSRYGERLSGHDATLRLLSDLRTWLFERLFPLVPLARRFGRGDLVNRLLADVEALDTVFLLALGPIVTALVCGIAMSLVLALALPGAAIPYALLYLAGVLLVPVGLIRASRREAEAAATVTASLREAVLDGMDGHVDLRLFGVEAIARDRVDTAARGLAAVRSRLGVMGTLSAGLVQLLAGGAMVATLYAGIGALRAGQIDGPLLAGLLLAVIASFEASLMLVRSATRLAGAFAAAERLGAVATAVPQIAEPVAPRRLPPESEIAFENVTFGYDPGRPVLQDISFGVRQGDCIAVTGPSGAGKSTLAQLLLRLVDPDAGTVRLGGCDIRELRTSALRGRIVLMTQAAPVFLDTVRANLLLGRPGAGDADLWHALDTARVGDFVRSLPAGLDTVLGEAGRTLSVGQARRICLARTLLSPAQVLVFDEPTSGLDAETAAAFLADLPTLTEGRTAIVITHDDIPPGFDHVLELKAGRLAHDAA